MPYDLKKSLLCIDLKWPILGVVIVTNDQLAFFADSGSD